MARALLDQRTTLGGPPLGHPQLAQRNESRRLERPDPGLTRPGDVLFDDSLAFLDRSRSKDHRGADPHEKRRLRRHIAHALRVDEPSLRGLSRLRQLSTQEEDIAGQLPRTREHAVVIALVEGRDRALSFAECRLRPLRGLGLELELGPQEMGHRLGVLAALPGAKRVVHERLGIPKSAGFDVGVEEIRQEIWVVFGGVQHAVCPLEQIDRRRDVAPGKRAASRGLQPRVRAPVRAADPALPS